MKTLRLIALPLVYNIIHGIAGNETESLKRVKAEVNENECCYETDGTRTSSKCHIYNVEFKPRKKRRTFGRKMPQYLNAFEIPLKNELPKYNVDKASDLSPLCSKKNSNDGTQNYCVQCDVLFRYDTHYAKHCKDVHGNKQPFPCCYCERMFASRYCLFDHLNEAHSSKNNSYAHWTKRKSIVCDVCRETLPGWMKFEEHALSKHKGMKMMRCSYCPKKYLRRRQMIWHEKAEHGKLEVKCEFCKNIFKRSDILKEHLKFCEKNQIQHKTGDIQVDTIIRSPMLVCDECGDQHKTFANLRHHHRLKHPHVKLHPCEHCDAAFSSLKTLERHIFMLHPGKTMKTNKWRKYKRGAIYTCEHCKENFTGALAYQKHGKQHPGMPMFRCKDCGNGYGTRKKLSYHANEVHGGVKTRCSYCSKCYFQISTHEKYCKKKIENRERKRMAGYPKHHCDICKRDFYMLDISFRAHVRRHKFCECCAICGQQFKKNSNRLRKHMALRHPSGYNVLEYAGDVRTLKKIESAHRQKSEMEDFEWGDLNDSKFNGGKNSFEVKSEENDLYIYTKSEESN